MVVGWGYGVGSVSEFSVLSGPAYFNIVQQRLYTEPVMCTICVRRRAPSQRDNSVRLRRRAVGYRPGDSLQRSPPTVWRHRSEYNMKPPQTPSARLLRRATCRCWAVEDKWTVRFEIRTAEGRRALLLLSARPRGGSPCQHEGSTFSCGSRGHAVRGHWVYGFL